MTSARRYCICKREHVYLMSSMYYLSRLPSPSAKWFDAIRTRRKARAINHLTFSPQRRFNRVYPTHKYRHFNAASIFTLHPGPKRLMAQTTTLLHSAMTPKMVNSHPFPMASISGCATTPPTHEKMLRTKLLTATPEDDLRGMNSVSIVVAMEKTSILPMPKKKLAMS